MLSELYVYFVSFHINFYQTKKKSTTGNLFIYTPSIEYIKSEKAKIKNKYSRKLKIFFAQKYTPVSASNTINKNLTEHNLKNICHIQFCSLNSVLKIVHFAMCFRSCLMHLLFCSIE